MKNQFNYLLFLSISLDCLSFRIVLLDHLMGISILNDFYHFHIETMGLFELDLLLIVNMIIAHLVIFCLFHLISIYSVENLFLDKNIDYESMELFLNLVFFIEINEFIGYFY